jgi:hypothetical protein
MTKRIKRAIGRVAISGNLLLMMAGTSLAQEAEAASNGGPGPMIFVLLTGVAVMLAVGAAMSGRDSADETE